MKRTLSKDTYVNSNLRWTSPEPKVLVQRIPVGKNTPHNIYQGRLDWVSENISPPEEMDNSWEDVNVPCNVNRVRRRLLAEDDVRVSCKEEDEEPLAQSLDDSLFPEIGNSGDALLKSPPNVDYLLGCVTPKRNTWNPEDVLKSHGIDIFGNNRDREEFTNFCENLIAVPRDASHNGTPGVHHDNPLWSCEYKPVAWKGSLPHHYTNHKGAQDTTHISPAYATLSVDCGEPLFSSWHQPPNITPSPLSASISDQVEGLQYLKRASSYRRKRRRGLGLTVCEALYYDGEKYTSIKVITDGTRKYRLVLPKEHKHSKGMPQQVPIYSVTVDD
ncbi:uncharacterized protein [Apostichopus japonicus]|uniref:uncharacterized protein isoform X2 n=1 Tax=Stichopus japonicus TaxID=307972 RepID=UPI003AB52160